MKPITIKNAVFLDEQINMILLLDVQRYLREEGIRENKSGPTRTYFNHSNGYSKVRQTRASIIAEWHE